MSALCQKRL